MNEFKSCRDIEKYIFAKTGGVSAKVHRATKTSHFVINYAVNNIILTCKIRKSNFATLTKDDVDEVVDIIMGA